VVAARRGYRWKQRLVPSRTGSDLPLLGHIAASAWLSAGADVRAVAERLGDTVQTVYATYTHKVPGGCRRPGEKSAGDGPLTGSHAIRSAGKQASARRESTVVTYARRALRAAVAAAVTMIMATGMTPANASETVHVAAADQRVSFAADGTTTYGTLHIPRHLAGQHLPAALLLPGSGPIDRNGDAPPTYTPHTLALIAGVLGDKGIMSLRFDKYFTGQTGGGTYAKDPGRIDIQAYIRQADAAYALLAARPEADQRKLLIAGHSEGGLTEMMVDETVRPHPAGLAMLEPQDLRILDLIRIQLDEQLGSAAASGQITKATAEHNKILITRVIGAFRARHRIDTTGMLPSVAAVFTKVFFSPANARYVRSDDAIYPPAVAARLPAHTRVLVTCGSADTNVPCSTLPPLLAGLTRAHATGPLRRLLPGIDHYLHTAHTPTNTQVLAAAATTTLRYFLAPWARPRTPAET